MRKFRNVAAALFFGALLWSAHPAWAGAIDPVDGNAWCPSGFTIVSEYSGWALFNDPPPTCDVCCGGPAISAEEYCVNNDHGDTVVNNGAGTNSCTCCRRGIGG